MKEPFMCHLSGLLGNALNTRVLSMHTSLGLVSLVCGNGVQSAAKPLHCARPSRCARLGQCLFMVRRQALRAMRTSTQRHRIRGATRLEHADRYNELREKIRQRGTRLVLIFQKFNFYWTPSQLIILFLTNLSTVILENN